ncbi:TPA: fluoride efflux transporter CrcB [Candidatus Dependentiae bacterium]|nr:MAG: Protein CrcB-like protein [candidate division TM6 bacterium GW2011_GWE2_31_21]KKP54060.1 MAG: Protein CrcB-like protein [candidate division TM6 bacterium GW2011_GWF2_33_332]HBS48358.1 fluoride efflux transporter CrcB [Candidatus Dependentiae bacterium]HBZ72968.1 fluoride efflux transporter CrcB [Candidatus Dependentiae bacterium]
MIKNLIYVILGGIVGTVSRYSTYLLINYLSLNSVFATLAVNLIGCFVAGLIFGLSQIFNFTENINLFLFVGILGAFTTFSTFTLDNYLLLNSNKIGFLILNILLNNFLGLFILYLGIIISKYIFR